jgi:prepilin signal peptidase PulO-like enzyme (type II secretory pathway)
MDRIVFTVFCGLICAVDLKTRRIPDVLLILWGLFMLLVNLCTQSAPMWEHLALGSLLFLLFYGLFRFTGALGFGDVKFAGLLGYALTFEQAFVMCFFSAFLCLLVYIPGVLWYHWDRSAKLPFAPFLGAGAMVAVIIW